MSININELKKMLNDSFPNSSVEIIDTVGDGHHLEATIISDAFVGHQPLKRHKMVYDALGSIVGNELHALALHTYTQQEMLQKNTVSDQVQSDHITGSQNINSNFTDEVLKKIDLIVKDNDVVLFMKGTKDMPMCGFSSLSSHILSEILQVDFVDIDVMSDYKIREKIKEYSQWPTIPQLYIKGSFIGGSDIMKLMYETGELQNLLKLNNINYKIAE